MRKAVVRLEWTPSVSNNVVEQRLSINGVGAVLDPTVQQFDTKVEDEGSIHAVLVAFNGRFESDPVVVDFSVGDLDNPQAPTGLTARIIDVVDEE